MNHLNIYDYDDYRVFLNDYYTYRKSTRVSCSFRTLAKEFGFSSSSTLKNIIDNKRSLSREGSLKIAEALELKKEEAAFFETLVAYNQSKTSEDKIAHFQKLKKCKPFRDSHTVALNQFEYFSNWYYSAIRELVSHPSFKDDPSWIAQTLTPHISLHQAREGMRLLHELRMIQKDESGRWQVCEEFVTSGNEFKTLSLKSYHRQMLQKAEQAIDNTERELRFLKAHTLSIPKELIPVFNRMIDELSNTMLQMAQEKSKQADHVYQVGFQLFPLSRSSEQS